MKPTPGLFQLFLLATVTIGSIQFANAQTAGGHVTFTTSVDINGTLTVTGDVNTATTSVVNLGELNVAGKSTFNGMVKAPDLSDGTGYQPVYVGPDGQIVTANGTAGPLFPSSACNPVNTAWHIGGTNFGATGYTDPSVGTCDDFVFGLKSNNTVRMWLTGSAYGGNIGFGTPTPSERFHFYDGNILLDRENATPFNNLFKIKLNSNSIKAFNISNTNDPVGTDRFTVYGDGKINIGSQAGASNSATLNVDVDGGEAFNIYDQGSGKVNFAVVADGKTKIGNQTGATNAATLNVNVNGGEAFNVYDQSTGKVNVTFLSNGNAYFGSQRIKVSHLHGNSEYQFNGKVGCKELVVVDPTKWADFVFDPAYKLPALSEVEAYYRSNKHLKDVPTEKEVKENGIHAADMYATLLQKIEELTIYTVELDKKMEQLAEENRQLKKQLEKK